VLDDRALLPGEPAGSGQDVVVHTDISMDGVDSPSMTVSFHRDPP
jgi:hypothetical protein